MEHPFFNARNFALFLLCGVVLCVATGFLLVDGLRTPGAEQLRRYEFHGPVEIMKETVSVKGTQVTNYRFTIPDGPVVNIPSHTPGVGPAVEALAAATADTTCRVSVGGSPDLELYALTLHDTSGEHTLLRYQDVAAAHRNVTAPAGLFGGGLLLVALMIVFRRKFLSAPPPQS